MELREGQKIRLKPFDECENTDAAVGPMFHFFGSVVTVEEVHGYGTFTAFTIREDNNFLLYRKSWIDNSVPILPEHLFTIEE